MNLFRTKSIASLQAEAASDHALKRSLSATSLVSLGIGAMVGAGIFVITGQAAALYAGPAIAISFVLSGIGCLFAGLCYAEYAAMIPIAGSAYTYSYATLGEFVAWMVGWDLILEYLFVGSTVAVGWSGHAQDFLKEFGIHLPPGLSKAPLQIIEGHLHSTGAICNLPAVLVVVVMSTLLVVGIKESAFFNNFMVAVKISVLLAVIGFGAWFFWGHWGVVQRNLTPFIPANTGRFGAFGWTGVLKGAAVVFFAYIGFDAVSTAAQEARNPQRDMPIGMLGALAICTLIFVALSIALCGMTHYFELNSDAPMVYALEQAHAPLYLRIAVEIAAITGLSSVILVMLMGQPRIFFSMAKDGLLPPVFARIHPRFRTPYITTIIVGVLAAVMAGSFPLELLGQLVSLGTLFAFAIVCIGVIVLRKTRPEVKRPFRTPWVPLVPLAGFCICFAQMLALPWDTWLRHATWMAIGFAIYFGYGKNHSKLGTAPEDAPSAAAETPQRRMLPTEVSLNPTDESARE
jgi:basic amino acid/polyamine antiporter, APA family